MPKQPTGIGLAEKQAQAIAMQMGYTLLYVELVKEATGRFLRFFIDKDGGVSLDDCEAFHRKVAPLCEAVDYDYMEVSSPGVDRPLKKDADFERAAGERVELRLYRPQDGMRVCFGTLRGLIDGRIVILCDDGVERSFERKQVALVKLVFEFDEGLLSEPGEEEEL